MIAEPLDDNAFSPRHGDRGPNAAPPGKLPLGLTVALSRETGARGTSIARRVGRNLGWEVYSQDLLEAVAREGPMRDRLLDELPEEAPAWAAARLAELERIGTLRPDDVVREIARMAILLAARGEVVLVGRGAGYLLPPEDVLHVRVVAPLAARESYIAQWLRLTREEATAQVARRDQQRAEFLATHYRPPADRPPFDLVLDSGSLGEELCAELIAQAARAKAAARSMSPVPPSTAELQI